MKARWCNQYNCKTISYSERYEVADKLQTYYDLRALGDTPNPDDVDRIVGNTCWTCIPNCSIYDNNEQSVVELWDKCYEQNIYEGSMLHICLNCLQKAVTLISNV